MYGISSIGYFILFLKNFYMQEYTGKIHYFKLLTIGLINVHFALKCNLT